MSRFTLWFYVAVAGICHAPLLVTSAQVFDGWYAMDFIHRGRWDVVSRILKEVGKPIETQIYRFWFTLENPDQSTHAMAFVVLLLTGYTTYRLLRDSSFFSPESAALIGVLSIVFPIVKGNSDSVILVYSLNYLSFLCGLWTAYFSVTAKTKQSKLVFRALSYPLLVFGFLMNSTLLYFLVILFFFFVKESKLVQGQASAFWDNAFAFARKNADYCLMPFVFWIVKKIFTPPTGVYSDYNSISFDWSIVVKGYYHVFASTIGPALFDVLYLPGTIVATLFLLFILARNFRLGKLASSRVVVASMFLLLIGVLPYILVGQYVFSHYGWATKNNLLMQLPIAILIERFFLNFSTFGERGFRLRKFAVGAFLILCGIANVKNYIRWEATSAIEHSVALQVAEYSRQQPISIAYVIRNFNVPQTFQGDPAPIVVSAMMRLVDRNLPIFGTTQPPRDGVSYKADEIAEHFVGTTVPYAYNDVQQDGMQVRITVNPADMNRTATELAIGFLKSRSGTLEERNEFLRHVASVAVEKLSD